MESSIVDFTSKNSLHPSVQAYPAHIAAVVVNQLVDDGFPMSDALRGSGLDAETLVRPATRISIEQILTLFRNAYALSIDPMFAARAGSRLHVVACGIYGYALLSSPNHEQVVEFVSKYHHMICPYSRLSFLIEDGQAIWTVDIRAGIPVMDPFYRFLLQFHFAGMLAILRDLYGRDASFSQMHAMHQAPGNAVAFAAAMNCEVNYECAFNDVRFDAAWMRKRMVYADTITHATMCELCDQAMLEVGQGRSLSEIVESKLLLQLGRFADIERMAEALSMSERTLQRRLEAEGVSYRALLDRVRIRLATRYLQSTNLTSEEIAVRLGYTEATGFRHAFRRWLQMSPNEFRRRNAQPISEPAQLQPGLEA